MTEECLQYPEGTFGRADVAPLIDAVDEQQQSIVLQCTLDQRPQVCGALRFQPSFGGRNERVLCRSFQVAA